MLWFVLFLITAPLLVLFFILFLFADDAKREFRRKVRDLEVSLSVARTNYTSSRTEIQDVRADLNASDKTLKFLSVLAPNLFDLLRYKHKDYYGGSQWRWDREKIKRLATDAKIRSDDDATLALIRESEF